MRRAERASSFRIGGPLAWERPASLQIDSAAHLFERGVLIPVPDAGLVLVPARTSQLLRGELHPGSGRMQRA